MLKKLIGIFIILTPFTSYFALSSWLRFPVLVLLLLVFIFLVNITLQRRFAVAALQIDKEDLFLIAFLSVIWLSWFLGFREGRSFNHALAYTFAIVFYFFVFRMIIKDNSISSLFVLKHFAISSLICCSIIILDWILINFMDIGIREYFVNVENKTANMYYFQRAHFFSVGGVAEEPGSMALLLNITAPLGLLYFELRQKKNARNFLLSIYAISLFCLFSTAGFTNVIVASGLLVLYNLIAVQRVSLTYRKLFFFISAFLLIAILAITNQEIVANIINEVSQKLSLSTKDASASIRTETWHDAIDDWLLHPFLGNGPGYGVHIYGSGYHSVYLTMLADLGILGITSFLIFILFKTFKLFQLAPTFRFHLGIAFIATALHFAIVGDFYHAPFWILLILIGKLHTENSILATPNENFDNHTYL